MVAFYKQTRKPIVGVYEASSAEQVRTGSAVILADDMRIVSFVEKPERPETRVIGACIYLFSHRTLLRTGEYIDQGGERDEPGNFIAWLCLHEEA